jgi:nicotinamidase-related amidase
LRRKIHPHLIEKGGAVLVVVDMQEKLVPLMVKGKEVTENIIKLIRFCRACKIPIILTEQYPRGLGGTVQEIRKELEDTLPIEKTSFSCFGSKDFRNALKRFKANTLIITGIEAHVCILQTALEALEKYRIHVIADAVSSHTVENIQIALQRMRDAGVEISSTEMLMYELLRDSKTKEFKEVKQLLRITS